MTKFTTFAGFGNYGSFRNFELKIQKRFEKQPETESKNIKVRIYLNLRI